MTNPQTMKLVPIEPTEVMIKAAEALYSKVGTLYPGAGTFQAGWKEIYKAMIDAS